jgi:hypothetical protein
LAFLFPNRLRRLPHPQRDLSSEVNAAALLGLDLILPLLI